MAKEAVFSIVIRNDNNCSSGHIRYTGMWTLGASSELSLFKIDPDAWGSSLILLLFLVGGLRLEAILRYLVVEQRVLQTSQQMQLSSLKTSFSKSYIKLEIFSCPNIYD